VRFDIQAVNAKAKLQIMAVEKRRIVIFPIPVVVLLIP